MLSGGLRRVGGGGRSAGRRLVGPLYRWARDTLRRSDHPVLARAYLRGRRLKRWYDGQRLTFVSLQEMVAATSEWIPSLDHRCDLIVGVPRSGMLVASIVATKMARPLATPDALVSGMSWAGADIPRPPAIRRALLIDDSVSTGRSLQAAVATVRTALPGIEVVTGALIVTEAGRALVDIYHSVIPQPRLFEWNLLHAKRGSLAIDLDGVLSENCPPGVDADEARYGHWLDHARPHLIPAFEVDAIVSGRLERYRPVTEAWLRRHHVRYGELILWDLPSKDLRRGHHARFKADALLRLKPEMYWESSTGQAREIWERTAITTLGVDDMVLFG